jgi:hypothetical protein
MQQFLDLYTRNMAEKTKGINVLKQITQKEGIRSYVKGSGSIGIYLKEQGRLIGGILAQRFNETYSLSYFAIDKERRKEIRELNFFLTQHLMRISLEDGM